MQHFAQNSNNENIKIIPISNDEWLSPWQYFNSKNFDPNDKIFNNWHAIVKSYRSENNQKFNSNLNELKKI